MTRKRVRRGSAGSRRSPLATRWHLAVRTAVSVLLLSVVGSSMLSVASAATTDQSALTITTTTGAYNSPLTLATSGGSDGGAVTYSVTSAGTAACSISGDVLTATSAGACSITATMAGNTDYNAVSSEPTTITIAPIAPPALTITSTTGSYNTSLTLSTSGGSSGGVVIYVVDDRRDSGVLRLRRCTVRDECRHLYRHGNHGRDHRLHRRLISDDDDHDRQGRPVGTHDHNDGWQLQDTHNSGDERRF